MLAPQLQRGVSMVEALVALVVLSVGMLGIAALHVESVKANRTAHIRTQAIALANDMADRIRANRTARDAYVLSVGDLPDEGVCVADEVNCSSPELALDDLGRWVRTVRAMLPGNAAGDPAETEIEWEGGATLEDPDTYRIAVRWGEPGEDDWMQYELNMQLIPGDVL